MLEIKLLPIRKQGVFEMHPIKKYFIKREIKKIDTELKNVYMDITFWCHGEMGYTQSPEELKELETKEKELKENRTRLFNELILWNVAEGLNAKTQKKRDLKNKEFNELIASRDL